MATAFRAHKGGTSQTGPTAQVYNSVTMGTVDYNGGGNYSSSLWTPVPSGQQEKLVVFNGQVWVSYDGSAGAHYDGSENTVIRIIKNGDATTGVTIGTAIGAKGPFPDDWVHTISMQDMASPGDTYGLWWYCYNASAVIDGNPLHTFWCGYVD